jgi:hypothetical protein
MITSHALKRQQQRGVPNLVLEWLERFGREQHDHHGAVIYYFDKQARRQLERYFGRTAVRRMHEFLNCYAIIDNSGSVLTVGHRYDRVRR